MTATDYPDIPQIRDARNVLGDLVRTTPTWEWRSDTLTTLIGSDTKVSLKLELFQHAGSFKPRGALTVMKSLSAEQLSRGVTAVSAGNHAMAVGYAASVLDTTAKVVMPKTASVARVEGCKRFGAEVIFTDDVHQAFELVEKISQQEGRYFVHPFEGPLTALGTATLGLEFMEQIPELDLVIVPIGGGGLAAGVSCAVKRVNPKCKVIGVEPYGACSMQLSFAAGEPKKIDKVATIADSLGAPYAMPYSFAMCREFIDEIVLVDDEELKSAMRLLFSSMKLAVEPAGAASTAALVGPLRERAGGLSVGLIVCGANIAADRYCSLLGAD